METKCKNSECTLLGAPLWAPNKCKTCKQNVKKNVKKCKNVKNVMPWLSHLGTFWVLFPEGFPGSVAVCVVFSFNASLWHVYYHHTCLCQCC